MATEVCGGGTSDLGYFLEVWVFIGVVGVENKSGGPTGSPRGTGARPRGMGAPSGNSSFQYFLYFLEKFFIDFHRILRTFISAQKQHHDSSAENSVSPG